MFVCMKIQNNYKFSYSTYEILFPKKKKYKKFPLKRNFSQKMQTLNYFRETLWPQHMSVSPSLFKGGIKFKQIKIFPFAYPNQYFSNPLINLQ